MRVQSTTSVPTQAVRRKPASGAAGAFKVDVGSGAERTEAVAAAQPLASLDTLVTLQEAPDDGQARKKAIRHAGEMLDALEGIRLDLLNGEVPAPRLSALLRLVRVQREQIDDPRLSHVLDEIELRARVELAKLGHAA